LKEASEGPMNGIVAYRGDNVVSRDIIGEPSCTCVFDAKVGLALNVDFVKPIVWNDNEWFYSCKVLDLFMHTARG
jgi:glyceraldehyde 3-phosphate dehydrogenase